MTNPNVRPDAYNPDQAVGQIVCASSDESGVPDVGVLLRLSETDFIWCGEITSREADAAGISDRGWHIVHHHGADRTVVAQVPDEYAGQALIDTIAAAMRPDVIAHIERLQNALKPFADEAEEYDYGDGSGPDLKDAPDASSLREISNLTVGDLRLARATLSQGTTNE